MLFGYTELTLVHSTVEVGFFETEKVEKMLEWNEKKLFCSNLEFAMFTYTVESR